MTLISLRGRSQLKSAVGRSLYREVRAEIIIHCLWSQSEPPEFCSTWTTELQAACLDDTFALPADELNEICLDYLLLWRRLKSDKVGPADGICAIDELDNRMAVWALSTPRSNKRWQHYDLQVDRSVHIWNGTVHAHSGMPAPGLWNSYRASRLMMLLTREKLRQVVEVPLVKGLKQQFDVQDMKYDVKDSICACVAVEVGPATSVCSSAYSSVWALFFAAQCALERTVGQAGMSPVENLQLPHQQDMSMFKTKTQLDWIRGRFIFVASDVGLRWASVVGALLRDEGHAHSILP
ncbi:hypothetical protein LTR95_015911 [Oleoguttula sp. CCFEE 5521]